MRSLRLRNRLLRIALTGVLSSGLGAAVSAQAGPPATAQTVVDFASYFGGSSTDSVRDVAIDAQGNLYATGGTASPDLPVTPGAWDRSLDTRGARIHDVWVAKFTPTGQLLWSTYLGGPEYDRAYAIEVDAQGFVYVGGRAGAGFPTTPGALQTTFAGDVTGTGGIYGEQDAFVAKLSPDGSRLVWSTYFGNDDHSVIRDIDIDAAGNVALAAGGVTRPHPHVTPGAFATTPPGGRDGLVAVIAADGSRVLWGSYLGGSGNDVSTPSVRFGKDGRVFVLGDSDSTDFPVTPGAFDTTHGGRADLTLSVFSADGARLEWSTYLGGSDIDFSETHGLALDASGGPVVGAVTHSADFPVTPGVVQPRYGGSGGAGLGANTNYGGDGFVAVFTPGGVLRAATYLGGSEGEGIEGIEVAADGRIRVTGATYSGDFPVSADAWSGRNAGRSDIFVAVLEPDLRSLVYSSLIGGAGIDQGRSLASSAQGHVFIGGATDSTTLAVGAAFDSTLNGASGGDGALVHLLPEPAAPAAALAVLAALGALALGPRRAAARQRARGGCGGGSGIASS